MSLEKLLKKKNDVSWLPNQIEVRQLGNKELCRLEIKECEKHSIKYRFLPYVPNGINWCELDDQDVISYPFTGCIMAIYTDDRVQKVCHVSTSDTALLDCKAAWEKYKEKVSNVKEFKPSNFIDLNIEKGWTFAGCYGLITTTLKYYAITIISLDYDFERKKRKVHCRKELELQKLHENARRGVLQATTDAATDAATQAATPL